MRASPGGPERGMRYAKSKEKFCQEVKFYNMYHFEQVKILAQKVKKVQI